MRRLFKNTDTIARLILACIAIMIAIIFMCSCSPQKRLNRLLSKHPELVTTDTVYKNDTTVVFGTQIDTVILSGVTVDTLVIREKQLEIKYFNNGKTVYLKGVCDTIVKVKKVISTVNTVSVKPLTRKERFIFWVADNIWLIVLVLLGLGAVFKYLLRAFLPTIKAYFRIP